MIDLDKHFSKISQVQLKKFNSLIQLYKSWNSKVNLISRRDIDNLYVNHILHSLSIAKIHEFIDGTDVLDVGTGGGYAPVFNQPQTIRDKGQQMHIVADQYHGP